MIEIRFPIHSSPSGALDCFDLTAGDGCITCYPLLDGVDVMIMRFEMLSFTEKRTKCDEFEINFCTNGRFETAFSPREHVLLTPGDMAVSCFDGIHGMHSESRFPLGYYEGICIVVNPVPAQQWMDQHIPSFAINFDLLKRNLLSGRWYMVGHAGPRCDHVFRELSENADYFDAQYLQLKVIELLMLLTRIPRIEAGNFYCSSNQLELIHHLRDHLLTNREHYVSLSQLAQEHGISVSHLQKLFKHVYGAPIYHYIKEYRLEQAAVELVRSCKPITEIALNTGYESVSKFTQCFKKRYGMTPSDYRKKTNSPVKWNN